MERFEEPQKRVLHVAFGGCASWALPEAALHALNVSETPVSDAHARCSGRRVRCSMGQYVRAHAKKVRELYHKSSEVENLAPVVAERSVRFISDAPRRLGEQIVQDLGIQF